MKLFSTTRGLILLALCPSLCLADNLFKNSDMETASTWAGDKKYDTLEGNRVLSMAANKKRTAEFHQEVKPGDAQELKVTFRYRTKDYDGRGMQLRATRDEGSSTFFNLKLKADGEWHDHSWRFTEVRGSTRLVFTFELLEGTGQVMFDDVMLDTGS